MHILKSIVIAFSMYSKIPMPQFEWKEEDMKHVLCFFPWIGIVIGLCLYFWRLLCDRFGIRNLCYVFIGTAIPLLLTGGFHVDGFMKTECVTLMTSFILKVKMKCAGFSHRARKP